MSRNENLHSAKAAKNDEFYTKLSDIDHEMSAYISHDENVFRGKSVLCPCDDPEWSNFTKYFATRFGELGLKRLVCTSYAKGAGNKIITDWQRKNPSYDPVKNPTHGKMFWLDENEPPCDPDHIKYRYLEGDGDFRSNEVRQLRDECDIVVTNPPFSLFREFLDWIVVGNKRFICIGPMNAITYKEVFPLIKDNKIWAGGSFNKTFLLAVPAGHPANTDMKDELGRNIAKVPGCCWYTNIELDKRHELLQLDTMRNNLLYNKRLRKKLLDSYGMLEYPKYDNYDAIEVPFTNAIPSDYDGVMGVPISFLDKYNPEQFEIVAFRRGNDGKDLVFSREREREFNRTFGSLCDVNSGTYEQSQGYRDKWEAYLRSNHNTTEKESGDNGFLLVLVSQTGRPRGKKRIG